MIRKYKGIFRKWKIENREWRKGEGKGREMCAGVDEWCVKKKREIKDCGVNVRERARCGEIDKENERKLLCPDACNVSQHDQPDP